MSETIHPKYKCSCEGVELGSYKAAIERVAPSWSSKPTLCIDSCILDEVLWLWEYGIITNGSCCGHNIVHPYIGVDISSVQKMSELNYKRIEGAPQHYYPISLERVEV